MERHEDHPHDGGQLGFEAAERIVRLAENYCASEQQYLALANEPRINELHILGHDLVRRERDLAERIRRAAPPGESGRNTRQAIIYWSISILLSFAAFYFALLSFAPYRLGWTGELICIGIALVTPYAVHELFEHWKSDHLSKGLVTLVFLAAVSGGALLAGIRADLLARQVEDATSPVTIESDNTPPAENHGSFYNETKQPLRLLMVLLAIAIDLGAGVAVHRAVGFSRSSGEDWEDLSAQITEAHSELAGMVKEMTACVNAPAQFEAQFWREFYRAMLTHTARKGVQKLLSAALVLLLVGIGRASAQEKHLNLIVAIDLSASVGTKGPDGKTDFEKNVAATGELLGTLPAGSRVTILGITGESFAEPDILLSAKIDPDAGYFGERLAAAHRLIVQSWQKRTKQLAPNAKQTDILGALLVAGQIFQEARDGDTKVLMIYSDMRQATRALNLETQANVARAPSLERMRNNKLELSDVRVFMLGVDAVSRSPEDWDSLRQFWTAYLQSAGASVQAYSLLRHKPNI